MSEDQSVTQTLELPAQKPFEVGEAVEVRGQGKGTVHQIFSNGVVEVAIPTLKYITVTADIVGRPE